MQMLRIRHQHLYLLMVLPLLLLGTLILHAASAPSNNCRSYCGNVTVDYPFATLPGCGHAAFRDLLFCINSILMFHLPSGSYRVLDIDYAYRSITLHDAAMSTCHRLSLGGLGNGFAVEPWRSGYLEPAPDNVFMLLGCRAESPLFQGFPGKHLPCRNVSGMGCEEYYACPAWDSRPRRSSDSAYGSPSLPECCSVPFGAIREINLTQLGCDGYSSAYSLAPLRSGSARGWSYGIRVGYTVPAEHDTFCRACEATGGTCGYDGSTQGELCLCGGWNSTSNCDSVSAAGTRTRSWTPSLVEIFFEFLIFMATWIAAV